MKLRGYNVGIGKALGVLGVLIALASPGLAAAPAALPPLPPAPPFAKVQYESLLSVNDRCAVRHGHLNPNIRPVYINRQPVGFC